MTGFTGATPDGDSVSWDIVQEYMSESTHKPLSLWNTPRSRNVYLYPYQRPSSPLLTPASQNTQKRHKGIFRWKSVDHIDLSDCQPKIQPEMQPESHRRRRAFLAIAARLWRRLKKNDGKVEDMDFFDRPLSEATMVETQEDVVLDWREKLQRASEGPRVTTASVPNLSHVHRLATTPRSPPTSYRPPYLPSASSYSPPRRSASARPYTPSNLHRAPTYPLPRITSAPNLSRGPHHIGRARSDTGSSRGRCPPFPLSPPPSRSNSKTPYYYF